MQARIVVFWALAIAASASCAPHESSPGSRPDSSAHLVGQPTTAAALAGDSSSKRWCFPSSQASLGGLSLDSPEPQITALLGPPLRRDTTLGSDGWSYYNIIQLRFPHLWVLVNQRGAFIEQIEAADRTVRLPGGVTVGMSLRAAQDSLQVPEALRGNHLYQQVQNWVGMICEGPDNEPSETLAVELLLDGANYVRGLLLLRLQPEAPLWALPPIR